MLKRRGATFVVGLAGVVCRMYYAVLLQSMLVDTLQLHFCFLMGSLSHADVCIDIQLYSLLEYSYMLYMAIYQLYHCLFVVIGLSGSGTQTFSVTFFLLFASRSACSRILVASSFNTTLKLVHGVRIMNTRPLAL